MYCGKELCLESTQTVPELSDFVSRLACTRDDIGKVKVEYI